MMQTSGSSPDSSTGILATRSIQSWMALVMWGTLRMVRLLSTDYWNPQHLHLDGLSKIVANTFSLDDVLVYLAGRNVVVSGEGRQKISLVVA